MPSAAGARTTQPVAPCSLLMPVSTMAPTGRLPRKEPPSAAGAEMVGSAPDSDVPVGASLARTLGPKGFCAMKSGLPFSKEVHSDDGPPVHDVEIMRVVVVAIWGDMVPDGMPAYEERAGAAGVATRLMF